MSDSLRHHERTEFIVRVLSAPRISGRIRESIITDYISEKMPDIADTANFTDRYGIDSGHVDSLAKPNDRTREFVERLDNQGVKVLVRGEDDYPEYLTSNLGSDAPTVLFALGNLELLNTPGVGFCGARNASDRGLEAAERCAQMVAWSGVNVVSGYARGVDMTVHRAALDVGSTTTVVLPEGILKFTIKNDLKDVFDLDRTLVLSQFSPALPWRSWQAMVRNVTICGLADVMIVVEAGEKGGTLAAGKAALKKQRPLFVLDYKSPPDSARGNVRLLGAGARAVRKRKSTNSPNLDEVFEQLRISCLHPFCDNRQMSSDQLFDA